MEYIKYSEQLKIWPESGEHILANFDTDSISVYQAFRSEMAECG